MEQAASFPHFNTRLGSQIIGTRYHFTAEGSLVEATRGLLGMGSDVIKLSLAGGYLGMPHDPSLRTAADLASRHPHFRAVLDMPFRYFMLWVHPHARGMETTLKWSAQEETEIYAEMYAFNNLYRFWYGRNPTEREVNDWAGYLHALPLSKMTARLLDAGGFAREVDAESFARQVAVTLYGAMTGQQAGGSLAAFAAPCAHERRTGALHSSAEPAGRPRMGRDGA